MCFPGGWIPSLADALAEIERCGLEVVDIENLRRHYAPTLDAWAERFERRWSEIHALDPQRFDERFRRVWRSYLVGCAEMFRSPAGYTHLFQIVFSKGMVTREQLPDEPRASVCGAAAVPLRRCATASAWPAPVRAAGDGRRCAAAAGQAHARTCSATAAPAPSSGWTCATSRTCSSVDAERGWVDVEGLVPYEALVAATLPQGVMPQVVPQLKTITAGGAVAGVGIEATSFRHGLVHDTLLEADVLLASGEVVTCRPDNEHRDLFFGLPNSYGTLGYALRLRLRTQPVRPYVQVEHRRYRRRAEFFAALGRPATATPTSSTASSSARDELVLNLGRFVDAAPRLQRLHRLRADLLPLAARQADRLPEHGRLPVALGHRLVLVLEEPRRAAPAACAGCSARRRLNSRTYTRLMRLNARWGLTRAPRALARPRTANR